MIYDQDRQKDKETQDPVVPKISVRQRIVHRLNDYEWWSLSRLQQAMYASSTRSRLQDIMSDDRRNELQGGKRIYEERWTTKKGSRFKEYRKIKSNQHELW